MFKGPCWQPLGLLPNTGPDALTGGVGAEPDTRDVSGPGIISDDEAGAEPD